jgi:hypothetical protein
VRDAGQDAARDGGNHAHDDPHGAPRDGAPRRFGSGAGRQAAGYAGRRRDARLDRLRDAGWTDAERLAPLVGKTFDGRRAWWMAVSDTIGRDRAQALYKFLPHPAVGGELRGPVSCVYHTGSLGQYLLVFPEKRLVVVRQRRGFGEKELTEREAADAGFGDILKLARDLAR